MDADPLAALDQLRVGSRARQRHRDRIAPRLGGEPPQLGDALGEPGRAVRHPLVAEGDHALQHLGPVAAHEHRRMRLLDRLRPAPDRVEVDVLAVVGGLVLGPDRLHRLDPLAHQREAAVRIGPVVLHLLAVPTRADAEQEAPAGQSVDARDLLRRDDRVALDHEADAGREQQALGGGGRRRERDERVVRVAVLRRQLAAARVGRGAVHRDVRVLGEEQRLEAALLHHPRERPRLDGVVGWEHRDSVAHARLSPRTTGRGGSRRSPVSPRRGPRRAPGRCRSASVPRGSPRRRARPARRRTR